jgi:uncharacterized protein (DUF952 family)
MCNVVGVLLHLTGEREWAAAVASAEGEYRGDTLDADGFIHLSAPHQVLGPANGLFHGRTDVVLLVIDEARLGPGADVRWELGAAPGDGAELFPHLYSALPVGAVVCVEPMRPDADGVFRSLPPLDHA